MNTVLNTILEARKMAAIMRVELECIVLNRQEVVELGIWICDNLAAAICTCSLQEMIAHGKINGPLQVFGLTIKSK